MKQYETNVIPSRLVLNRYEKERYHKEQYDLAMNLNKLGVAHYFSGKYKDAILLSEQALKIYYELFGEDQVNSGIITTLNNLATAHNALCNYQESIECHRKAFNIHSRLPEEVMYSDFYTDALVSKFNTGHFGSYKEARKYYYEKCKELLSQFASAADTGLNEEFHYLTKVYRLDDVKDFDDSEELPPYSDLMQAMAHYGQASYMQDRLKSFYENQAS